jgi:hypothetical protein
VAGALLLARELTLGGADSAGPGSLQRSARCWRSVASERAVRRSADKQTFQTFAPDQYEDLAIKLDAQGVLVRR